MARALIALVLTGLAATGLRAASEERPGDVSGALNTLLIHEQARAHGVGNDLRKGPPRINELILPDQGDIAVIDDGDGVAFPAFLFDLDGQTLELLPDGDGYRYLTREGGYDLQAAADGEFLTLGDDDSALLELPFTFPFYGVERSQVFVNSDGNLTFGQPDFSSTARDAARAVSLPRICPFFIDLDPTQPDAAVRVFSSAERLTITWINAPEWVPEGVGRLQNFQVTLLADGRIAFAYRGITVDYGVIGLAPGERFQDSVAVDFSEPFDGVFDAAFVEIFSPPNLDLSLIGQKFYLSHGDAYDFLVLFHNYEIPLDTQAFAFYRAIRNFVSGIGPFPAGFEQENFVDFGDLLGSPFRLQGLMFMGELSKYPDDPNQRLDRDQGLTLNTPLTVLAHEAGHRFLANVFFVDPATNLLSLDMLGRQLAHWSFFYNSEASFLEGNRIVDRGSGPFRFETTKTVEGFSPLDRYLMGLIPAEDVPSSFLVRNPDIEGGAFSPARNPLAGIQFEGERVDVATEDVTAAMGRRVPDHTVSQKDFRYAFVLLVEEGTEPSAADIRKIDRFRREFETYMEEKTGGFDIETELVSQLTLNTWPAAGVLQGTEIQGAVFIQDPLDHDTEVLLSAPQGVASVPEKVVIPAGEQVAEFPIGGARGGVEVLGATIDETYERARSNIRVQATAESLRSDRLLILELLFGDPRERLRTGQAGQPLPYPILVQVVDENGLFYENVPIRFIPSGDGSVTTGETATDTSGLAETRWTLATERGRNTLTIQIEGGGEPLVIEAVGTIDPTRGRNSRRDLFELF